MHELHATQAILDTVLQEGKEKGAVRITGVFLLNGALSTYSEESVRFYWEMLSQGTACEGAALHFRSVPALSICQVCAESFAPQHAGSRCPHCGSRSVLVTQGIEFQLESIEIERD